MIMAHVKRNDIEPEFLYDYCTPRKAEGCYTVGATAPRSKKCLAKAVGEASKGEKGWSHLGYYNNFFVTYVPFWRTREVRGLLKHIEESKGLYVQRWNDLIVQTVAVQMFLPKKRVHWFDDFTYEHASINKKGVLVYGGLAVGVGPGRNATAEEEFKSKYGRLYAKVFNNKKRLGTASDVLWYD